MRVSLTQSEKYQQMLDAVEILFNNKNFGLVFSDIEDAWLYGDTLRDLMLFKNPPVSSYQLYLQIKDKKDIAPWFVKLKNEGVNVKIIEKNFHMDKKKIECILILSLEQFNIDYEMHIVIGTLPIKEFLYQYSPISLSLLYWDISDIFLSMNKKERIEQMIKKIWKAPEIKKDIKNKSITILKQKWMGKPENYGYLETYLEKTHQKLSTIGYK
jgi:hypothetical protein